MKARVTNSISQAVGRSVEIGSVRLRFLPRPGFEIDDLLVRDDSAFGAEPLVRAPDVMAAVSLGALLRGRMEIARLSLSEPSLNLTRNRDGQWNLEDLIDRTSHSSLAPTGSPRQGRRPSFPYIEANGARLNLKLGTQKTHFALTIAEFALWQESADTWGARLQARPIRTDANLTDTGIVNVSALWRRSAKVHETPIEVAFQWKQAQIGQVSKLVYGSEKDWRGAALLSGAIVGTPARLKVVADANVDNFRREDVISGGNLRLAAHCVAEYAPATREVAGLDCTGPVGSGYLQLKGGASGVLTNGQLLAASNLWLVANRAPARSLVNLLQHSRPEFPQDLQVTGEITSNIQFLRADSTRPLSIEGNGSIHDLEVTRDGGDAIGFGSVPFKVNNQPDNGLPKSSATKTRPKRGGSESVAPEPRELRAEIGPVNLALGRSGPLTAQATFTRSGFTASEHGDSSIARLLQTAKALGLPTPGISGDGAASVNLHASGAWFGEERPLVTGTAHLRGVHAQVRGVNAAIAIQSADLAIDRGAVSVQNLSATAGDSKWHGSMRIPRPCPSPSDCELQFRFHSDQLSSATLNNLVNPSRRPKAWYRFLSLGKEQPSYLLQMRASGSVAIDSLSLGSTSCAHFTSDVQLDSGTVSLANFKVDCLDGTATGSWRADFTAALPKFAGSGVLDGVSLSAIAQLMHDGWVEGRGRAEYQFKSAGSNIQDLLNSADLNAEFRISGGRFAHIVFTHESGPLRASDFSGTLHLADQAISFQEAKLTSGREVYTVSGTASLGGALNLKAVNDNAVGYSIGGTFLKTRVSAIPNTEASLKP